MNNLAQPEPGLASAAVVYFAVGACLVAWALILERRLTGKPVVAYQSRRRVPWRGGDLLAILAFYFVGSFVLIRLADIYIPDISSISSLQFESAQKITAHPIVQLLTVKNWNIILMCGIAGVVVAPITEEMFFRVLLQGWLENVERYGRRRLPRLRRLLPLAVMPIILSSLVFAWLHFRKAAPPLDAELLIFFLAGIGVLNLLTLIFGVAWVRWRAGATALDLGWAADKFLPDLRLGLIAFIALIVPTLLGQYVLSLLLPKRFAPDPITLFFLALGLGFLYYRTHRVTPAIVVHMALNASSLLMALLSGG